MGDHEENRQGKAPPETYLSPSANADTMLAQMQEAKFPDGHPELIGQVPEQPQVRMGSDQSGIQPHFNRDDVAILPTSARQSMRREPHAMQQLVQRGADEWEPADEAEPQ